MTQTMTCTENLRTMKIICFQVNLCVSLRILFVGKHVSSLQAGISYSAMRCTVQKVTDMNGVIFVNTILMHYFHYVSYNCSLIVIRLAVRYSFTIPSTKKELSRVLNIIIGEKELGIENVVDYLGVWLDDCQGGGEQLEKIEGKFAKGIFIFPTCSTVEQTTTETSRVKITNQVLSLGSIVCQ